MLLTVLIAWPLLSLPLAVIVGKCMAVGMRAAEGATFVQLELELATSESARQPVSA